MRWPEEARQALLDQGWLRDAGYASQYTCTECEKECTEEVQFVETLEGRPAKAFIPCIGGHGRIYLSLEELRYWSIDINKIAASVAQMMELENKPEEIVSKRLWWLGMATAGEGSADFFLARGTRWRDAAEVFGQSQALQRSALPVVLTLSDAIAEGVFGERIGLVSLSRILSLDGKRLHLDQHAITQAARVVNAAQVPASGNLFRCDGATWTVTFEGETKTFRDTKGMRYIAVLLEHPNHQFTPGELVRLVNGEPDPTQNAITAVSEGERLDGNLHLVESSTGEQFTPEEIGRQIKEFDQELADAERDGNPVLIAYVKNEKQEFMRKTAGHLRRGNVVVENQAARKLVSHHVNAAIRRIGNAHPALGTHLTNTILPVGNTPCYTPGRSIFWLI